MAFFVLGRLDFALVVGIVPAAMWIRSRSCGRALTWWCAGTALIGLPAGAWWVASWHHVLSTSATIKNAEINHTIAVRFGGRLSFGYANFVFDLGRSYLKAMEPWVYVNRLPYAAEGVGAAFVLALLSPA